MAKTPTRKRTNRHLTPTDDQAETIPEKESRLYDIFHEEIEKKTEIVTLNGAAMIREKLNISQKGEKSDLFPSVLSIQFYSYFVFRKRNQRICVRHLCGSSKFGYKSG